MATIDREGAAHTRMHTAVWQCSPPTVMTRSGGHPAMSRMLQRSLRDTAKLCMLEDAAGSVSSTTQLSAKTMTIVSEQTTHSHTPPSVSTLIPNAGPIRKSRYCPHTCFKVVHGERGMGGHLASKKPHSAAPAQRRVAVHGRQHPVDVVCD
jgi:hypothetical protein